MSDPSPPAPNPRLHIASASDSGSKSPGHYSLRQRRQPAVDQNNNENEREASPSSSLSSVQSSREGSLHEQQSTPSGDQTDSDDAYEEEEDERPKKGKKAAGKKRRNSTTDTRLPPGPPTIARTTSLPGKSSGVRNLPFKGATGLPFPSNTIGTLGAALAFPQDLAPPRPKRESGFVPPETPQMTAVYWKSNEILDKIRIEAGRDDRHQQQSQKEIENSITRLPTRKHRAALCLTMNRYTAFCGSSKVDVPTFPITALKVAIFLVRATDTVVGSMFRALQPQPSTFALPLANALDSTPMNKVEGEYVTRELVTSWAEALGYAQAATRGVWQPVDPSLIGTGEITKDPHISEVILCFEPLASFKEYKGTEKSAEATITKAEGKRKAKAESEEPAKKRTKWVKGGKSVEAPKKQGSTSPPAGTPAASGSTPAPTIPSASPLHSMHNAALPPLPAPAWPSNPHTAFYPPPPNGYGYQPPYPGTMAPYQFWQQPPPQTQAPIAATSSSSPVGAAAKTPNGTSAPNDASSSRNSTPSFAFPSSGASTSTTKAGPQLQVQTHEPSPMLSHLEPSPISGTVTNNDHSLFSEYHNDSPSLPSLLLGDERTMTPDELKESQAKTEDSAAALLATKEGVIGDMSMLFHNDGVTHSFQNPKSSFPPLQKIDPLPIPPPSTGIDTASMPPPPPPVPQEASPAPPTTNHRHRAKANTSETKSRRQSDNSTTSTLSPSPPQGAAPPSPSPYPPFAGADAGSKKATNGAAATPPPPTPSSAMHGMPPSSVPGYPPYSMAQQQQQPYGSMYPGAAPAAPYFGGSAAPPGSYYPGQMPPSYRPAMPSYPSPNHPAYHPQQPGLYSTPPASSYPPQMPQIPPSSAGPSQPQMMFPQQPSQYPPQYPSYPPPPGPPSSAPPMPGAGQSYEYDYGANGGMPMGYGYGGQQSQAIPPQLWQQMQQGQFNGQIPYGGTPDASRPGAVGR